MTNQNKLIFVPKEISNNVMYLLSKLGLQQKPKYLPCRPSPESPQNECFSLVEAKVKSEGGAKSVGLASLANPTLGGSRVSRSMGISKWRAC